MALSVGVRTGSRILVGDHCVEVKAMLPANLIVIAVDNGDEIIVSEESATIILPGVKVFSGMGKNGDRRPAHFRGPTRDIHKTCQKLGEGHAC
jgi:hypothetical protein